MKTWPKKAADLIGGGLFLTLFIVFVIQVTARFAFNKPMPWTDEAAVVLYVWVILWAAAFCVPEREQVVFDLVWNNVSWRARQVMKVAGNLLIGGLALCGIPASFDYVRFMGREGTPVLGLPFSWALVVRSAWSIWQAFQGVGLEAELRI